MREILCLCGYVLLVASDECSFVSIDGQQVACHLSRYGEDGLVAVAACYLPVVKLNHLWMVSQGDMRSLNEHCLQMLVALLRNRHAQRVASRTLLCGTYHTNSES